MNSTNAGVSPVVSLIYVAIAIVEIVAFWKVFTKAGRPGWAIIIPFYNLYLILKMVGRPGWWLILFFIPLVNLVVAIMTYLDLARSFGRGTGFGIGLILLSPIFIPILGFGSSRYLGPAGPDRSMAPPSLA
jgi:hypothetical protein